jgi:hypothetical protein
MLLRDHPLMCSYGISSWPPTWTWIDGPEKKHIDYEGSEYIGCLLIHDPAFCSQIVKLLQDYCNRPIAEIGSIDLAHTL